MKSKNLLKICLAVLVSFIAVMMGAMGGVSLLMICLEKGVELGWFDIEILFAKKLSFLLGVTLGSCLNGYLCVCWIKGLSIEELKE